jgi:hypothetical protein
MFICFAARRAIQFSSRTIDLPRFSSLRHMRYLFSPLHPLLVREKCPCRAQHALLRFFLLFIRSPIEKTAFPRFEKPSENQRAMRWRVALVKDGSGTFTWGRVIPEWNTLDIFITWCRLYVPCVLNINFDLRITIWTLIVRSSHIRSQPCFRIF